MTIPRPNVTVKRNEKGRLRVYVDGQLMAGTTSVVVDGPNDLLKIEVIMRYVELGEEAKP